MATLVLLCGGSPVLAQQDAARARYLGEYDRAIALYESAAQRDPTAPEPARGLARVLAEVGRYEDALAAAEQFTRRAPRSAELWTTMGEILRATGRPAQAESAFVRAINGRASDSLTARLGIGLLRHESGRRDEARRVFDEFIDVYNRSDALTARELTAVATAVRYLSRADWRLARDALRAYDHAIAADSTDWEPQIAAGELFLERYNGTDARAAFEAVLARNPKHPGALLGLAHTHRFEQAPNVTEAVQAALEVNPNLADARALLARLHLEREDYDAAEREVAGALAVNPTALEALSVRAAAELLRGDQSAFAATRRRALTINRAPAEFFVTVAELAARNRRYHDAARLAGAAVRLDDTTWRGFTILGINQMRVGLVDSGRANLETAFGGDPHDPWTKNTLDLLDDLAEYDETTTEHFRIYIARQEARLLSPYVATVAEAAFAALATRYNHRPPAPIRVEIFPHHADFSVRTVGLVGLGAVGVSFGPVIAMDSPSALDAGEFNWGATLWHELAHTFHVSVSDYRVPRWFTEGCAVYEERRARPSWGADVTPGFLQAYREERLRALGDLNEGFVRPAYPQQVQFSYYQASLVCELIERDHGVRGLLDLLGAYGSGLDTPAALQRALGIGVTELQARFDAYMTQRFGGAIAAVAHKPPADAETVLRRAANRNDFWAQLARGQQLFGEGRMDDARPYLEQAKTLFPEYTGNDSPYWLLAQIHARRGANREAVAELRQLVATNEQHHEARLLLADLSAALADPAGAAQALEEVMTISPYDPNVHARLAGLYEHLERFDDAVRERRAVLALDPVDRADALYRLAHAHHRAGDVREARRALLRALEIAPAFEAAQRLLLEIHEGRAREKP